MKLQMKLAVNAKKRAVSLNFEHTTKLVVMDAEMALLLARNLILCVKEIESEDQVKRSLEEIIKSVN